MSVKVVNQQENILKLNHKLVLFAVLAAAVMLLSACASGAASLAGTSWRLVEMNGQLIREDIDVTLNFDDEQQVSGSAGCNSYGGSYSVDGSNISFSQVFHTEMACVDQTIMDTESAFLAALNSGGTFDRVGDSLTINAADGTTLNFSPAS